MKVSLGARARRDLAEIGAWIAQDDPEAADRFVAELTDVAKRIGAMPHAFPIFVRANGREIHKRAYPSYAILYYVSRDKVRIARIVNVRRDLSALFKR